MIKNRTVLVLGAGASMHLDFPSGIKLMNTIVEGLRNRGSLFQYLSQYSTRPAEISDFSDALNYSGTTSIDQFLEHRNEYIDIGKRAIAYVLCPLEKKDSLFRAKNNWYKYIFDKMNGPFDEFSKNKLSIITFNYDRSFEEFLFNSVQNFYGKTYDETVEVIKKINIIHVHGQLGYLPWQNTKSNTSKIYSNDSNAAILDIAAKQIKIIHENIEESVELNKARTLLDAAERICLLGFGYHDINMKRLRFRDIDTQNKQLIVGSAFGLTELEKNRIIGKYKDSQLNLPDNELEVLDFIRNHFLFI